jgi:AraC-like DNA-binding protein
VGGPFHPQWIEFTVAVLELSGRRLFEGESGIIDVKLPFARHAHSDALDTVLPCRVTHDHDALEIAAPLSHASRPLVSANSMLRDMLVARAELLLAELPDDDDIVTRARTALDSAMSAGDSSLETVARSLHMSPRSLQRALRERDTSYREMVDSSRQRTASLMLARQEASVSEVAFLLGFSEVAAFHRAFRRWTGIAPGEFRKRALRGA